MLTAESVCKHSVSSLRPVSAQENKHRIELECTFPSCIIHTAGPKKLKIYFNSLSSGLRITGLNWNRKLVPKALAQIQFCSDPVRSHAMLIFLSGNRLYRLVYMISDRRDGTVSEITISNTMRDIVGQKSAPAPKM